ncbi:MAG: metallophosphoesterase [Rhodobacteraceae bacterium]|nr:metallophosphoesterase [Paracoccaceae bacterium]
MLRAGLIAALLAGSATGAQADLLYAWSQYDRDGAPVARAIMEAGDACPLLAASTGRIRLEPRAESPPPGFAEVTVCEGLIPEEASSASIEDLAIPMPSVAPQTIVVLGDTGCRVKGSDVQNCTGEGIGLAWNFAGIAAAAAEEAPELVIHVGDFHYREYTAACGANCDPANLGFTWQSWKVDFFEPAKPLLAAAPWIPLRGNHEDCTRAWRGWFYFFDPGPVPEGPWPAACPSAEMGEDHPDWFYTGPYAIEFGAQRAVVMDTSYLQHDYDPTPDTEVVARYREEFDKVAQLAGRDGKPVWLLSHRPIWAVASYSGDCGCAPAASVTDLTLQTALAQSSGTPLPGQLPNPVTAVISGHIHLSERVAFSDGRPPQLVFGASGTQLDPDLGTTAGLNADTLTALASLKADPEEFIWSDQFEYGLLNAAAPGWNVALRTLNGRTTARYALP